MSAVNSPIRARKSTLLSQDVAAMIRDARKVYGVINDESLAHDIILVVRERVLRELASYARENIR